MTTDELLALVKRMRAWADALEVLSESGKGLAPAIRRQAGKIEISVKLAERKAGVFW